MKFEILNRYTGAVQFTAEIDCAEDAGSSFKLGLAIKWALSEEANLRGADLRKANLRWADLRGANLYKADLSGADLYEADLSGANLYEANLSGANLRGADLRKADLRGANLYKADLRWADLRGANLYKADLSEANLRGANLRKANLYGAYLIDAGQDIRGYRFVGVRQEHGFMIHAGCRWFTLAEAVEHWSDRHYADLRAECLAKIEFIKTVALARGWHLGE